MDTIFNVGQKRCLLLVLVEERFYIGQWCHWNKGLKASSLHSEDAPRKYLVNKTCSICLMINTRRRAELRYRLRTKVVESCHCRHSCPSRNIALKDDMVHYMKITMLLLDRERTYIYIYMYIYMYYICVCEYIYLCHILYLTT